MAKVLPTYAIDVNFSGIGGIGEFGDRLIVTVDH